MSAEYTFYNVGTWADKVIRFVVLLTHCFKAAKPASSVIKIISIAVKLPIGIFFYVGRVTGCNRLMLKNKDFSAIFSCGFNFSL